jgi:hypothetical protein
LASVPNAGSGFPAMVLTHRAASDEDVDALLAAAVSAGGRIITEAAQAEHGYPATWPTPTGSSGNSPMPAGADDRSPGKRHGG